MNRRHIFQILALAPLVGLLGCDEINVMESKYSDITLPEFSDTNLHKLLDALLAAYESKGMSVSDSLLSPLHEEELKHQCSWFPGYLPPQIISLYAWRGGQVKDAWETEFPFWFRDMSFCSIERAEQEYISMMQSYGSLPDDHEMLKYSFPFASFNGGWYVIPTRGQPFSSALKAPVICVLQGIDIYYFSIEAMVSTCIDWVKHDKYGLDSTLPPDVEMNIWRKHNPGIFLG